MESVYIKMKKQYKQLISNLLIWGGSAVISATTLITLWLYSTNSTLTHALSFAYLNLFSIISIIIGEAWRIKK